MNTYEPHNPHYSHLETITRFHNAVLDATEQYFINQDEGISHTENITIIVHGQVFTFDLYPELVDAMTSFAEAEADRYNIDSDSYLTEPAGVDKVVVKIIVDHMLTNSGFITLDDYLTQILKPDELMLYSRFFPDGENTDWVAFHEKYFG
jgi:hypothetical protein